MCIHAAVRFARDAAPDHIHDPEYRGAPWLFASRSADSVSAVSPLWLIRNHDVIDVHDRVPVPELRRILHFRRDPGDLLEHVLADQRRMPRRAACRQNDPPRTQQPSDDILEAAQLDVPLFHQQPPAHGVPDRLRLLVDLLQHEVIDSRRARSARSRVSLRWTCFSTATSSIVIVRTPVLVMSATSPSSRYTT